MLIEPGFAEQELLAETLERAGSRMRGRERLAEAIAGAAFACATAALWLIEPPHAVAIAPLAVCILVLALASLVRIDTPFGFTAPIQLGFVPLLFAAPVAIAPIAVVVALGVARLPDVISGRLPCGRLLVTPGNSWFAIGPVAVFALSGVQPHRAGAALLLAALAAQFLVDFTVSVLRFGDRTTHGLKAHLTELWVYGIDAALSPLGFFVAKDVASQWATPLILLPLLGLLAIFARERHDRLEGLLELNTAYRGTALVLGDVLEADDGYTGEHSKGVVALALALAGQLRLSAEQRRNLEFAALLHDVGKIAIPKEIINKPGKLDPEEWRVMKTHTIEGQKMLDRVGGFMHDVGVIVRAHHERWDGGGYPDGLAGEAIPLEARIIACCDTWDAMRTDRAYRKALPHAAALTELFASCGTQLDPGIVPVLARVVESASAERKAASRPSTATSSTESTEDSSANNHVQTGAGVAAARPVRVPIAAERRLPEVERVAG